MNEKKYKKRFEFQNSIISRQSDQIEDLKSQIENLKLELKEKDGIINSVSPLREELKQNVSEIKQYKEEYKSLIDELRLMKNVMNKEAFKNRWWIVRLLIRK